MRRHTNVLLESTRGLDSNLHYFHAFGINNMTATDLPACAYAHFRAGRTKKNAAPRLDPETPRKSEPRRGCELYRRRRRMAAKPIKALASRLRVPGSGICEGEEPD